ncbi:MAG: ATP-binding protein [Sulfurimonas sp.]|nr:ATP-binding protein [Sulfurimonas sp.]
MFKSGMPVKGKNFIDRTEHLKKFNIYLQNHQHIMIKAPRRYGKTSLVVQLFELNDYKKIYVDIKRATSLKQLASQIIDEVYAIAGFSGIIQKASKSITTLFKQLRASVSLNIDTIELTLEKLELNTKNEIEEMEYFLYSLDLVEKIAQEKDINIKFAMDEFQDILNIASSSILDKVRSVMQDHQNVTYIFLGSIETIMNKIFSSKSSPFFHFTRVIDLGGFDVDELLIYTKKFFDKQDIVYDDSLTKVLHYLEGHPYYSVKTLQIIHYGSLETANKLITTKECIEALTTALYETKPYLEEIIEKVKVKKHHHIVLWSLANEKKVENLDSPTLYKTYSSLQDMGYIKKQQRGEYIITDIFLKIMLQQNNDISFTIDNKIIFKDLVLKGKK